MELQTILSNEQALIRVNQERSYIELDWLTHPSSTVFREIFTLAHQYARQHQLTKWLCNIQQNDYFEQADHHWLVEHIFRAFDPDLQHDYAYLIKPTISEVVTAYHILDLVELDTYLQSRINVAIFVAIDLAQQWLFTNLSTR